MHRYLYILCLLVSTGLFAQQTPVEDLTWIWEKGTPHITNYTPEDYKASIQNWCAMQADNGIMYIGNLSGLLEFDGTNWRLLTLPNGSPVKSMAKGAHGTIFIGAVGDLGYLQPDSVGKMRFVSLLPHLDTSHHDFADIWFSYAAENTIYFVSDDYIFRWNGREFKAWKATRRFGWAWLVHDQLYVQRQSGLFRIAQDSLQLIPGGEQAKGLSLTTLLPFGNDKLLLIEGSNGAHIYDDGKILALENKTSKFLKGKSVIGGKVLPHHGFVLHTAGNGLIFLDSSGIVKKQLTQNDGLNSNVVLNLYADSKGMLWLTTENGINKVETGSALRVFNKTNQLTEFVNEMAVHNGRLYAATNDGLFYLAHKPAPEGKPNQFIRILQIKNQIWDVLSTSNGLLIGSYNGFGVIENNGTPRLLKRNNTFDLLQSSLQPEKIYVGTTTGIVFELNMMNGRWVFGKDSLRIDGRIYRMTQDSNGDLWLATRYSGLYRVQWEGSNCSFSEKHTIAHYDSTSGIPVPEYNIVKIMNGVPYVILLDGIYRFEKTQNKFVPDSFFTQFKNQEQVDEFYEVFPAGKNGYWLPVSRDNEDVLFQYADNEIGPFQKGKRLSGFIIDEIADAGSGVILFGGDKGIIALNSAIRENLESVFPVHIREVRIQNDSLVFAGHEPAQWENDLSIPFQKSAIRFAYALPAFDLPKAIQYQTYLEGFDDGWSKWSRETQRDFTNLYEGDYIFHVRAKNIYGSISKEDRFAFTITPPLHRTWWAYVLYGIALAGGILLFVRWRSRKLQNEKLALETIVAERTGQLAKQATQLQEMDQQKSRFFANISHEFRTPLTLIKGPVDQALHTADGNISKSDLRMIRDNSNRLLRLVGQLLDLSKLDAGKLKLSPESGSLFEFLRAATSAFSSYAAQHNFRYVVQIPDKDIIANTDFDKLEKIINNLLSNAFKFTADGGKVVFKANHEPPLLHLMVQDDGIGMQPQQVHSVFDRFYQVDDSTTKAREGAGIGLALTKELVRLMKGEIKVKSTPGEGTTFRVQLPVQEVHPHAAIPQPETHPEKWGTPANPQEISTSAQDHDAGAVAGQPDERPLVLIVEDHADMRRFIRKPLQQHYQLSEAADGKQGLHIARDEIPDLIITDLMMPEMDGISLCHALKTDERTSHIPVIMLTAKAGRDDKLEGLETGADAFLTKPFDPEELLVRVKNLVDQRRQLREKYRKEAFIHPGEIAATSLDESFLRKLHDLIENNLSEAGFGIAQMQSDLAMSKTQLHRKIKALTNEAPGEFLRHYRLKRAEQMIKANSDTITRIAYATGFNNLSYFAKCFKDLYGVNPSEYGAASR